MLTEATTIQQNLQRQNETQMCQDYGVNDEVFVLKDKKKSSYLQNQEQKELIMDIQRNLGPEMNLGHDVDM